MDKQKEQFIACCESELPETQRRAHEDGLSQHYDAADRAGGDVKTHYFQKLRATLSLREQEVHGDLGTSPEHLRGKLQERAKRLSELAVRHDAAGPAHGDPTTQALWRFDWRRGAVCLLMAGLAAMICRWFEVLNTTSVVSLFLLATLAFLGPWPVRSTLANAVTAWEQAIKDRKRERERRAVKEGIRRLEDKLDAAVLRRAQAEDWIRMREQLLHAEYEVQRIRAARAADRLRVPQQPKPIFTDGGSHESFEEYAVQ